jgi:hypothetical protein
MGHIRYEVRDRVATITIGSDDDGEGVAGFLERRPAVFTGR